MAGSGKVEDLIRILLKWLLSVPESKEKVLDNPKKFLIVRQHNQLGDMIAGTSLLRAIKEKYPTAEITIIVSPENKDAVEKNRLLKQIFVFNKKKLFSPLEVMKLLRVLRSGYDVAIVPVVVSISFTSNLLARLSKSKTTIGCASLEGKVNKYSFLFHHRIHLDWRLQPDSNVADRILDIVRPFGINTKNYKAEIYFDQTDIQRVKQFFKKNGIHRSQLLVGIHAGAGKIPNRWSANKFIELIKFLKNVMNTSVYLTGSDADKEVLNFICNKVPFNVPMFLNCPIPEVAAIISRSDLFITNDTGIMHVAGTTDTPQISLFGPTNAFNWAPVGKNKYFIQRSEFIDDISLEDVIKLCQFILGRKIKQLPSVS